MQECAGDHFAEQQNLSSSTAACTTRGANPRDRKLSKAKWWTGKKRYKHPYQQASAVLETFETVQLQAALAWLVQALHMEWSKACKED